jgi:outer membrane biosynthesis protein TonB
MIRLARVRFFPAVSVLLILSVVAANLAVSTQGQDKHAKFTSPELLTASDIVYPINSGAAGVVIVAVHLDTAGMIKSSDVVRDVPSLTSPVLLAIPKWTFKPATLDGKEVDSTLVVSVVFNPSDYRLTGSAVPALGKETEEVSPDASGFLPPNTIASSWADYPINSVAQGAVILNAHVNRQGHVVRITSAWGPFLTKTSTEAAKRWNFEPAKLDGTPVGADVAIGYVYRPPNIAVPVRPYRPTTP